MPKIAIDRFDREEVTRALEQRGLTPVQNLDYGFHVRGPGGHTGSDRRDVKRSD